MDQRIASALDEFVSGMDRVSTDQTYEDNPEFLLEDHPEINEEFEKSLKAIIADAPIKERFNCLVELLRDARKYVASKGESSKHYVALGGFEGLFLYSDLKILGIDDAPDDVERVSLLADL